MTKAVEVFFPLTLVSIGSRLSLDHKEKPFILSCTFNPIMGHFSMSSTCPITRHLFAANRFDFNMHSYESDISFGIEYRTLESAMLKLRFGLTQGIGLFYQIAIKSCTFRIGVSTELTENPKRLLGIQFTI